MKFQKYPNTKESEIPWVGEIPESWDVKPLFTLCKENHMKNTDGEIDNVLSLSYGNIIRRDIENNFGLLPESFDNYQIVKSGNIILRLTDLQNDKKSLRVGLVKELGIITSAYTGLIVNSRINSEYLYNLLHSYDIAKVFYGFGGGVRQAMKFSDLRRLPIIIPSSDEQMSINRFIENVTQLIATKIFKMRELIELLRKKRKTIINQTVTKGLDSSTPMKDSGITRIGRIPKHWDMLRCAIIFKEKSIKKYQDEAHLSVYRDYGVILRDSRDDNHNIVSEDDSNYKLVDIGDFVFNKMKCWTGSLGLSQFRGLVSPAYRVYQLSKEYHGKYFHHLLRSNNYIQEFERLSYGIRPEQWELRHEDFRFIMALIPPFTEQEQIADFLDAQVELIDTLVIKTESQIERLQEFKQSLISSVVTGKINLNN